MKKTIRKIVEGTRNVPSIVFLILAGVLNYAIGQTMLNINTLYSEVTEYGKIEFTLNFVQYVGIWFILKLFNGTVGKIEKNKKAWKQNNNHQIIQKFYFFDYYRLYY